MAIALSVGTRNAQATAVGTQTDAGSGAGKVRVYTGTAPSIDSAVTGTLLVEWTLSDPAFGTASSGTITAASMPKSGTGVGAGTAGYFRVVDSAGNAVYQGSVTATGGGGDMTMSTTTISVDLAVSLTALSYTKGA